MSDQFSLLLNRISGGEATHGTYIRHAIIEGDATIFEDITVVTPSGQEYQTRDEQEYDHFLQMVDYRGQGVSSSYNKANNFYRYESLGTWHSMR